MQYDWTMEHWNALRALVGLPKETIHFTFQELQSAGCIEAMEIILRKRKIALKDFYYSITPRREEDWLPILRPPCY